jgi:hypothetical protein
MRLSKKVTRCKRYRSFGQPERSFSTPIVEMISVPPVTVLQFPASPS